MYDDFDMVQESILWPWVDDLSCEESDCGYWDDDYADPDGESALLAESESNPRDLPCPSCGEEDKLTRIDRLRGRQCDACAREYERGY